MFAAVLLIPSFAFAADTEFLLVIRDHRFEPQELTVPAGKKFKLLVDNRDFTAEEFESPALTREKVVPGKSIVPVFLGPLAPGRYPFFGEFTRRPRRARSSFGDDAPIAPHSRPLAASMLLQTTRRPL